jgi:RimJ/RimL family protein N-acetyltransferase
MILLHKLAPPENKTLFTDYPEFNEIWEVPALQVEARTSYEDWESAQKSGEIFSINEDEKPIGIIGWFEFGEFPEVLRLRYYGIVPSKRGKKYGEEAMRLFLDHLSKNAPQYGIFLAESVTLSRTKASHIITHFKKMGFKEFLDPNYGSNADCGPVQSLRIRIPRR